MKSKIILAVLVLAHTCTYNTLTDVRHCSCVLQESRLQLVHGDCLQLNLQELVDRVTHAAQAAGAAAAQQADADSSSSSSSSGQPQPQPQTQPQPQRSKRQKVKVVANLPYNITKDFLVALFPKGDLIAELSIMIQVSGVAGS